VLQRLCANDLDVPPGRMVYTALASTRAADSRATAPRSSACAEREFFLLTGSAQATRDFSRSSAHLADEHASLVDVTGAGR
jgi:4-methylaminobutanoate oxidase (formaldehyde-forming)